MATCELSARFSAAGLNEWLNLGIQHRNSSIGCQKLCTSQNELPPPPLRDTGGDWYGNVSKTGKMPQYMGTLCGDTI